MKYKVSVIKKIAFLVMTMALAVAMVACQGAAGTPGEPGKAADPVKLPPLKAGTISAMGLVVGGDVGTVDLSGYFSDPQGQTLAYAATSSMTAYATATVTSATLTVTAVAAGKSTITVTATDPDKLTATQTFMVTVTAASTTPATPATPATPDPTADSYDMKVGGTQDIVVSADEVVYTDETNVSAVQNSSTSWTLTANKKGEQKVQVRKAATADLVRTITLDVANRAPTHTKLKPPKRATLDEIKFDLLTAGQISPAEQTAIDKFQREYGKVRLYRLMDGAKALDLDSYFTDPDDGDKLTYTGSSGNTIVAVVNNIKAGEVYIDVVRLDTFTFDITFTATDDDKTNKLSSKPLVVTVSSADVLEQDYEVIQQRESGNFEFSQVDVGFRSDATHELVFEDGFLFAEAHDNAVTSNAAVLLADGTITAGLYLAPNKTTPVAIGQSAYGMLSTIGPIKSVVLTNSIDPTAAALRGTAWAHGSIQTSFDGTVPTADTGGILDHVIRFEATAPGRATITISYTIYVAGDPGDPPAASTVSRTLTLNILPVLES